MFLEGALTNLVQSWPRVCQWLSRENEATKQQLAPQGDEGANSDLSNNTDATQSDMPAAHWTD